MNILTAHYLHMPLNPDTSRQYLAADLQAAVESSAQLAQPQPCPACSLNDTDRVTLLLQYAEL
jgi:hypothetical protein